MTTGRATGTIDPLSEPLPFFKAPDAALAMQRAFGVSGELSALHGERDLNFRVVDPAGRRFLLKIHNPADGEDVVGMQTAALAHVARLEPTLPICRILPATDGAAWTAVTAPDGRTSLMRLLSFLDGHNPGRDELDEAALFEWGRTVARLGRALRGFFDPAAGYRIQWDIRRAAGLRRRLVHLEGEPRRLVSKVLDRFDAGVAPVIDGLRAQVIHNDMSRENVLVDDNSQITGITDFGDMTHTALVCDLAVSIADVLDGREGSLELAGAIIAGYQSVTVLEAVEAAVLADLVAARCATTVAVTAWRHASQAIEPGSSGGALGFLEQMSKEGFDKVGARFAAAAATDALPYRARATVDVLKSRRATLGPLSLSYDTPLHLVRGEGVFVFDRDGERYLDAYNNVPVVGHCHPEVVRAVSAQMRLLNTNTRYVHEASAELAERLVASAPGGLDRVLFLNSGSEANDVAWRMACHSADNRGVIVTRHAYHGITHATTAFSPEGWPHGFAPSRTALVAPPAAAPAAAPASAPVGPASVREAFHISGAIARLSAGGHRPAALFVEPAFTSDGVLGPADDWIREAAASVWSAGGLVVADEVQAGYGRTGGHLWSITASGVRPDFLTLGKPMGNGYPVAAVLTRSEIADRFIEETGYFSTFGGGTAACVAALAVLAVLEEEGLVANAASTGAVLLDRLREVAARHESVGEVRGWGLICGMDIIGRQSGLPDPEEASRVVNASRRLGVLIGTTGPADNVLKIRPPLVFEPRHAEWLAECLDEALGAGEEAVGRHGGP